MLPMSPGWQPGPLVSPPHARESRYLLLPRLLHRVRVGPRTQALNATLPDSANTHGKPAVAVARSHRTGSHAFRGRGRATEPTDRKDSWLAPLGLPYDVDETRKSVSRRRSLDPKTKHPPEPSDMQCMVVRVKRPLRSTAKEGMADARTTLIETIFS